MALSGPQPHFTDKEYHAHNYLIDINLALNKELTDLTKQISDHEKAALSASSIDTYLLDRCKPGVFLFAASTSDTRCRGITRCDVLSKLRLDRRKGLSDECAEHVCGGCSFSMNMTSAWSRASRQNLKLSFILGMYVESSVGQLIVLELYGYP